jgi:hypothetical protein
MLRWYCALALALTVILAFFSRAHPIGWYAWDKSLGDALSALAVYLGLLILYPAFRPASAAVIAAMFCLGIEGFKLTGLPAAWREITASRLIFGTTPSLHNLACYFIAITFALVLHTLHYRRAEKLQDVAE